MKKECEKCELFQENPAKAEARLHINSFLLGGIFTVIALLLTLSLEKVSFILLLELVSSVPLIFFASLSYAKIGYKKNHTVWDTFGWITNNIGYLLFLNSTGLIIAAFFFKSIALIYFGLVIILSSVYYILNIISQPGTLKEHLSKLILFLVVIIIGGVIPII